MTRIAKRHEDPIKYVEELSKGKIICECGHRVILPPNFDKVLCSWCNNYVFRDKKAEFEFRMKERMNNGK